MKKKKVNIVEVAKKKRHIHLLEKLRQGIPLKKGEIKELEDADSKPSKIDYTELTQVQITNILDITPSTLNKWLSNGCPYSDVKGKKRYNAGKVFKWRIDYQKELDELDGDLSGESTEALERWRNVKCEKEQFELDIKKKKYVPVEEVALEMRQAGELLKKTLEVLPKENAVKFSKIKDPKKLAKAMEEKINEILVRVQETVLSE